MHLGEQPSCIMCEKLKQFYKTSKSNKDMNDKGVGLVKKEKKKTKHAKTKL